MQIENKPSPRRIIVYIVVAFLLAVLVNSNFFVVSRSAYKDAFRGRNYARAEKNLTATQRQKDDNTQENVIADVSDYVQSVTISFESPATSTMVVQFYSSTGDNNDVMTHIADGVVLPGQTTCYLEVHQFVEGFVVRQVSPESGNVEGITELPIKNALINANYMGPVEYFLKAILQNFRLQGIGAVKKIVTTFILILISLALLYVKLPEKFERKKVFIGIGAIDIGLMALFVTNAIRQNAFPCYRNAIIVIGLLLMAAVSVAAYLLFVKNEKLYKAYVASGFLVGLAFMIMLPVYQVPDEPTHLYAAYELSNYVMGKEISDDGTIVLRQDDYDLPLQTGGYTAEDYNNYYRSIFQRVENDSMVSTDRDAAQTWHYQYVMGAIGITLGRLLGMGPQFTFLLGRFFALVLFVAMMSYAIKRTPVGKVLMFVLALLPVTVQQSMSYSYDTVLIPAVFVTVALSLRLACEEEKSFTKFDYIMLTLCAMACMPAKGHAYFLTGFLPLLVLFNQKCSDKIRKRNAIIIFSLAVLTLLATVALQNVVFPNLEEVPEGYQNYISYAGEEGYTIRGLLSQPVLLIKIVVRTIVGYGPFYIETFLGNRLGWLELFFSDYCLRILFFIVLLACIPRKEQATEIPQKVSLVLITVGILETLFVFAGFLLSWTPISEGAIAGVQGRYFIPTVVVMFVALRGRLVRINRNVDRPLCMALVITLCLVVLSIISQV